MAFGSMGDGDDDAPMSDINVTPLVDVMLVLLIVFMITMPVLTHSLTINLPVSSSKTQEEKSDNSKVKVVTVAIDKSGQYAFGAESNKVISLDEIKTKFAEIATDNPEQIVAVSADKGAPYEYIVKVLEAAKEAKLQKFAFNTEMKK